jgi:enoyl-CoA hydratase/carnithine racemase
LVAEGDVRIGWRDRCAWVTIDRPPLNLFTPKLIELIAETFTSLTQDASVCAAAITGAGRHLTGGMQIEELRDLSSASAETMISGLRDAIEAIHQAPFPTVAMINGACLGAGFELVMACDLRVLSSDARLGLPEVRIGIPSVIHAALLPGLIGPGRAAELLLTGEAIQADQALQWGLANRVVEPDHLLPETERLVEAILRCSPAAIRLQKELMIRWRNADQHAAIGMGVDAFRRAYATDEPREAMQAFLEKRPPAYG